MEPKKNQHKKLDNMQKTTGNENIDLSTTNNFLVTAASSLQNDSFDQFIQEAFGLESVPELPQEAINDQVAVLLEDLEESIPVFNLDQEELTEDNLMELLANMDFTNEPEYDNYTFEQFINELLGVQKEDTEEPVPKNDSFDQFIQEALGLESLPELSQQAIKDQVAELLADMKNPSNEEEPVTGTGIQQEAGKKENINLDHIFPFDDDIIGPSKNAHLKYVNVRQLSTRVLPRFNLVMEKFRITFRHKLPNDIGQVDLITRALKELVAFSQKQTDFKPGDKLNVFIENPKFTHRIASGYECTDHVNRLKDKIAQILTSDESKYSRMYFPCTYTKCTKRIR